MTKSTAEVARRVWARGSGGVTSAEGAGAAAQRICDDLRMELGRWIGAEGYRALLDRALQLSGEEHPVLSSFSCHDGDAPAAEAAARAHGTAALAAGIMTLVATLTELLGRIIGEEMAVKLVDGAAAQGARSSIDSRGGGNG